MPSPEPLIREAIASYLKNPSQLELAEELVSLARALDALPVYADMGAALLIRPTGEVLSVSSDESWTVPAPKYKVVTDPTWIERAYDKCALRYPRLRDTIDRLRGDQRSDI
jgi:hypothetical protein